MRATMTCPPDPGPGVAGGGLASLDGTKTSLSAVQCSVACKGRAELLITPTVEVSSKWTKKGDTIYNLLGV